MSHSRHVLVTGGAGYVGSALVPRLLGQGHRVTVLDLYLYGREALDGVRGNPNLREIEGDLRDPAVVARAVDGCDAVIHLACISNDPSFELDPELGKSINYDAFRPLVQAAKRAGVSRFIYASSSSVYGLKADAEVTETLVLEPLTDYSKFKALCEKDLEEERTPGFTCVTLRPATVCGYAPRLRLDLTVNILTNLAAHKGVITVFGGTQKRPNIHVEDMVDAYLLMLAAPADVIDGEVFNVGFENHTVMEIAEMVRDVVGPHVGIEVSETNDLRSYHVSSAKIRKTLGFTAKRTVHDAAAGLLEAFRAGKVPDSLTDPRWFNIKRMQQADLH